VTTMDVNVLPVGHPARPATARALAVTAAGAIVFAVFAVVSTQVVAIRVASPWQDDPYDAVVTFTMFFVPGLCVVAALRVLLCRRAEPLATYRVDQLLRTALLVLVLVDVTALADWMSLLLRADQRLWSPRTPVLVLGLAIVTVAATVSHVAVRRARATVPHDRHDDGDWLDDAIVAGALLAARAGGPLRFAGIPRFLVVVVGFLRAYFVVVALLGSVIVGALVVARLTVAEGSSDGGLFAVEAVVFAGGTFAFVMIADAWLRLVATPARVHTVARVGATVAAAALPTSLAMRDLIWSTIGHPTGVQTAGQLAWVTLTSAVICGAMACVVASAVTSA
jgi:hypothetical protein